MTWSTIPAKHIFGGLCRDCEHNMYFPTNGIAEPFVPEDRSSCHILSVIANGDTLRPPTPTIDEDHHPLTWWKETGFGERYIKYFVESVIIPWFCFFLEKGVDYIPFSWLRLRFQMRSQNWFFTGLPLQITWRYWKRISFVRQLRQ